MRMLEDTKVAARIPVQDLQRARLFYAEKLGLEPSEERLGGLLYRCGEWEVEDIEATVEWLRGRGVMFEEYDFPGLRTVNGIAEVAGNYPSKGGVGEWAAWFRDSEGNLFGIGQPIDELRRTMLGPDR